MTNWGLVLCTVYFLTILIISGEYVFGRKNSLSGQKLPMYTLEEGNVSPISNIDENGVHLPKGIIFLWLWHEITFNIVTTLVILYWTLVYNTEDFASSLLTYSYINDHGGLYLLLFIDFWFHTIPIRIVHVVYSLLICVVYAVITVVYNFAADQTVYSVLDWKKQAGWSIVYIIGAIVLILILQLILYGCYRLKLKLKSRQEL